MLKLHLRTIPHFFDPAKASRPNAIRPFLLCLLSAAQWQPELAKLVALAEGCADLALPRVWKLLVSDLSEEESLALQNQLQELLPVGPRLELENIPLRQWPALFAQSQACLSLSESAETALPQVMQALAMDLPVLAACSSLPAPYQALPVHPWPFRPADFFLALEKGLAAPQPPLRAALLHCLDLPQICTLQSLQATEVVALLFWGRSGSVFLQSLLDRHPEILSTPATVLMRFYEVWPDLLRSLVQTRRAFELGALLDAFAEAFPVLFEAAPDTSNCNLDHLGPERDQVLKVSYSDFKQAFLWLAQGFYSGGLEISSKTFFVLLHYAYELAQGLDISDKHLIAYQLHRPGLNPSTTGFFRDFPQTRVLGMAREPMRALHSHLRMYLEDTRAGQYEAPRPDYSYHEMVRDGTYLGYYQHQLGGWKALQNAYEPPLYEMRLEALHAAPESELKKLAQWLGIAWAPCLLESSFNGLTYWGDSRAHQPLQGFSRTHPLSQAWEEHFSWLDKEVLWALLAEDLTRQGYGSPFSFVKMLLPLLIFWPTCLERQAFEHALRARDQAACEDIFLTLLDRWKISFMVLFGRQV
ncbi:MAG: sulfotransferase [Candidatus Sericytochromatia bacterium]|nr:sulfotransferase [Candidatus Sericytochromatia bacterium]